MPTKPPPTVHFLFTGGTIDSAYIGTLDTVRPLKTSALPELFKELHLYGKIETTGLFMKDSREITVSDMQMMLEKIEQSRHARFIITHGTYTMPDSARFLKKNLKRKGLTIILTGSMVPINFTNSDAAFNLGFAYAAALNQKPGIFIAMNGKLFSAEEVAKNIAAGKFVSLFNR